MPNEVDHLTPRRIIPFCWRHKFKIVTSEYLYFEKGNRERMWFKGSYGECENKNCGATRFYGPRRPYFQDRVGDPGPDEIMKLKNRLKKSIDHED